MKITNKVCSFCPMLKKEPNKIDIKKEAEEVANMLEGIDRQQRVIELLLNDKVDSDMLREVINELNRVDIYHLNDVLERIYIDDIRSKLNMAIMFSKHNCFTDFH